MSFWKDHLTPVAEAKFMQDSKCTQWADRIGGLLGRRVRRLVRRIGTAFLTPLSFALNSGHFKSAFAEKALSRGGKAIPWFTYPAIDFLVAKDFSASSILEFGGGQSTKFWGGGSQRCDHL